MEGKQEAEKQEFKRRHRSPVHECLSFWHSKRHGEQEQRKKKTNQISKIFWFTTMK